MQSSAGPRQRLASCLEMLIDLSRRSALDGRDLAAAPVHTERAAQAVPCWAVLGSLEKRQTRDFKFSQPENGPLV